MRNNELFVTLCEVRFACFPKRIAKKFGRQKAKQNESPFPAIECPFVGTDVHHISRGAVVLQSSLLGNGIIDDSHVDS